MESLKCAVCGSTDDIRSYTVTTPSRTTTVLLCAEHADPLRQLTAATGPAVSAPTHNPKLDHYVSTVEEIEKIARRERFDETEEAHHPVGKWKPDNTIR